jgi:hypothetical protein
MNVTSAGSALISGDFVFAGISSYGCHPERGSTRPVVGRKKWREHRSRQSNHQSQITDRLAPIFQV